MAAIDAMPDGLNQVWVRNPARRALDATASWCVGSSLWHQSLRWVRRALPRRDRAAEDALFLHCTDATMDKLIALLIILVSLTMLGLWSLRTFFSEFANGTGRDGQLITRPLLVRRLDLLMVLLAVTLLVAVVIYIVRGAG
jgi:hypothetical protein